MEKVLKKYISATRINGHTLVGILGIKSYPIDSGNCFTVEGEDGNVYKIVNFVLENLKEVIKRGIDFPMKIGIIHGNIAILHESRIPSNWYNLKWCEVCCPVDFLPISQQLERERKIENGSITVYQEGIISWSGEEDL